MASQMSIFRRTVIQTLKQKNSYTNAIKTITTFPSLSQSPQISADPSPPTESTNSDTAPISADPSPTETTVAEPPPPSGASPLPPNPASGSPLYGENWRSPVPVSAGGGSVMPIGFLIQSPGSRVQTLARTVDAKGLEDVFADWTASQNWVDMKQLFELWVRSLDKAGKPNKPEVNIFNSYLRAHLMMGATTGELLDLLAGMEDYAVECNTASFNLVLKAMVRDRETEAVLKLLDRLGLFLC